MDYRAYPILYVDDEVTNLQGMRYLLEDQFTLLTSSDPDEALRLLADQDIAVLLTDQRMPIVTGVELCAKARQIKPDTVRILITAYADLHVAIDAVNLGQVRRYLPKPHSEEEVVEALRTAIDFFHLQRSVRDMEVRILRSGTQITAQAIRGDLAGELAVLQETLAASVEHVGDLLAAGLRAELSPSRAVELFRAARQTNQSTLAVSDKLVALVKRLREGAGIKSAASARCDAVRAIDAMVRIMRADIERYGTLEVQVRGAPSVPMEASALGHVVMQLLTNAAHARDDRPREKHHIVVAVEAAATEAIVSVNDNGCGIPPDVRERLFDPRFTTKAESKGLGLAIVRELVTGANGSVEVFSEVGIGTTVTVKLPLVKS
ncbi:MAG: ATP-binding protein [Pseudomonadota bacterium]